MEKNLWMTQRNDWPYALQTKNIAAMNVINMGFIGIGTWVLSQTLQLYQTLSLKIQDSIYSYTISGIPCREELQSSLVVVSKPLGLETSFQKGVKTVCNILLLALWFTILFSEWLNTSSTSHVLLFITIQSMHCRGLLHLHVMHALDLQ